MAINVCYRTDCAGYCDHTVIEDSVPMIFEKAGVSELNLSSVFVAVGGATLSSLDRLGAMTGTEQNHANWKEREIQRVCSPWAADLCLVAELPKLVE